MGILLAKKERTQPKETVKSAGAFADYVKMGPKRSLQSLANSYVRDGRYSSAVSAVRVLKTWSTKYHWQSRLAESISAAVERNLEIAAELDAETFLKSSRIMNTAVDDPIFTPMDIIRVRESVRRPLAKGATNVNVHLDIQISQLLDQIAEEDGLTDIERRELEVDIEEYLAGSKS